MQVEVLLEVGSVLPCRSIQHPCKSALSHACGSAPDLLPGSQRCACTGDGWGKCREHFSHEFLDFVSGFTVDSLHDQSLKNFTKAESGARLGAWVAAPLRLHSCCLKENN